MKDTKKTVAIVVAVVALVLLGVVGMIALGEGNAPVDDKGDDVAQEVPKGKCEIDECMKLLEPKMTVAEANEVIGFDGEKDATAETYTWQLTSKSKISIEYKDDLGTIKASYDKDEIKDSAFKISKGYELQDLLKEGTSYTYKETVEQFDGVEGHLETKAPTFEMYAWVNGDGMVFRATFSDSIDGKTSIISIR